MAKPDDKPTSFKEWVQQKIPGATSPEMKDTLTKVASSEMKGAFTEMARQFQQPFQGEQPPPAAPPGPSSTSPASAPEASMPEASTTSPSPPRSPSPASSAPTAPAPASAPKTPLPRRGEQRDRVKRILRKRYSSDGKVPRGITGKTVWEMVCNELAAEKKAGQAPTNEEGWPDPSPDTVARAMEELGCSA